MDGIAVTRVAVVEHSDLVRNGLEKILSEPADLEVAASVARPAQLSARGPGAAGPGGLDVIVLGVSRWFDRDPAEAVGALSARGRVLVVSESFELHRLTGVIRAGAFGAVSEQVGADELRYAVRAVARGGIYVSPSLSPLLHSELREPDRAHQAVLAPRECETLGWLAIGLTHRQIAGRMGLTEATVSTYIKRIRGKLGVGNKADLTRVAIELGLLEQPGAQRRALAVNGS